MMKRKLLRRLMAKRLTKALREKRRWLGVVVEPACTSREDVEARIAALASTPEPRPDIRLMDFVNAAERAQRQETTEASELNGGLAILRIHLKDSPSLRPLLQSQDALQRHGMSSVTTSGKIRLVRQRLGLPTPKRKR